MPEEHVPDPQTTSGRDVFISYASQDAAVANTLVEALERHGLRCWIAPRDVKAGAQYADAIVRALAGAKAFVLVLSEHAIASAHVGREIERAAAKRRPILAWRIDAAPLTPALEYFLGESQWIEAHSGKTEAAYARLIDAMRDHERSAPTYIATATSSAAHPSTRRKRMVLVAVLASVALTLVLFFVPKDWRLKHAPAEQPSAAAAATTGALNDKSIAVLPFTDMSEKHDQEYFSDGLSEELIDHLAHNTDLKVIARTSSFAFKGKNEDMRSIASKLGVAHLLEGSVRKSGNELRITAQLIRASDGVHLWSETYDRQLTDIFRLQDEISTTVARALNVALNAGNSGGVQPASKGTTNIAAYNLLLQGNYFYWRGNPGDTAKAIELFKQAIRLDSRYALAWAKLARAYAWQGFLGELTGAEGASKGRDAVERALALDPNCAEAYYARGNISRLIVGDWSASISDNERAAALDPQGEVGVNARANILSVRAAMTGHYDDVARFARQRLVRDPLDVETMMDLVYYEQAAGQLDEAAAASHRLLELNPDYVGAYGQYGVTLLLMGKNPEALAAAEKESDKSGKLLLLGCAYWAMGRRAESNAALDALERGFADRKAYEIASTHACRGETDAAFAWLDRAYQQRKGSLQPTRTEPLLRKLRQDPRFDALLRKAKLVE
jgi:TolB-like protein